MRRYLIIAREDWRQFTRWVIVSALVVVAFYAVFSALSNDPDFFWNIFPEIFGIGVTVFLINRLAEWSRFRSLFRQLKNASNDAALDALDELRAFGVLKGDHGRLQKLDLKNARLTEANFTQVNLTGTDLSNSKLRRAVFSRGEDNSVESQATIVETKFHNADLTEAAFYGAAITCTDFTKATLTGAWLEHCIDFGQTTKGSESRTYIDSAIFEGADLTRAKMRYLIITGKSSFYDANLEGANFTGSTFKGSNLSGAKCKGTIFVDAVFEECTATGIRFEEATLVETNFTGSHLEQSLFRDLTLTNVILLNTHLTGARFDNVQFINVTLPDGTQSSDVHDIEQFVATKEVDEEASIEDVLYVDVTVSSTKDKQSPFASRK